MRDDQGLSEAAQLFKVLGNESRLRLLRLLGEAPLTVGELVAATGLSQPLVSQHLRSLKDAGLVTPDRRGQSVSYQLADEHVSHIVDDAVAHAQEPDTTRSAD
ncbi:MULTISPECIES: ArsR/SmtB family transcription factor [unclassified Nesterenkonia]|uniref:ArsR/SmtB family transcription factor n=1 Tax=unclassified Nesterenkonia TaxID=2629769 RepID=UPI000A19BBFE|nr:MULTISPECIES: metalloregulator ArsR/SmtB family transcription factor [unclassified Nesterenkonia]MDS2173215.1 metalloregulator ArsR/SmtB family transcription factor [Nesterenkonia sp. CL21]OSM42925.1 transcriptional regulator [Nesterenkonia sp. PF2B19]